MTTAPTSDWGADSEFGVLRDVLLCPPDHFRWRMTSAISAATLASGRGFDPTVAAAQHAELVAALEGAAATCHFLTPDSVLPYQVFARDSSVTMPSGAVVTQPRQSWRRGEYAAVLSLWEQLGARPWRMVTAGSLEGGDVILVKPGLALVGSGDARTEWAAAEQLAGWLRADGWEVRIEPTPPRFVHMDVLVCVVADGLALVCEEVVSGGLLRWLKHHGVRCIAVTAEEAFRLGVNVLALGDDRVVSARRSERLNAQLRAEGLTVFDPDLELFTLGGGGPRCLTQALRREPSAS